MRESLNKVASRGAQKYNMGFLIQILGSNEDRAARFAGQRVTVSIYREFE